MPLPTSNESSEPILESLKELLETLSTATPKQQYCVDCGWLLTHLNAYFWIEEGERVWKVLMPCCQHCHPELAARMAFPA